MKRIDIVTTAVPRCLLYDNMMSFLDRMKDRGKYRMNWYCHVDWVEELKHNHWETMTQASALAGEFTRATISTRNKGLGFVWSVLHLLEKTTNNVIFVEDDWYWHRSFKVSKIEYRVRQERKDAYSFRFGNERLGAMGCCYWTRKAVDYLLARRSKISKTTPEKGIKRVMRKSGMRTVKHRYISICRHQGARWAEENWPAGVRKAG